jgi:hypothetical protein
VFACPQITLVAFAAVATCAALAGPADANAQSDCVRLVETVLDDRTRIPLPGAAVTAYSGNSRTVRATSRSDSLGNAVLCVPLNIPVTIRVEFGKLNKSWETVFTTNQAARHVTYIEAPASLVRGRVISEQDGSGVSQALIRVRHTNFHTITDADGRFVFEHLPFGEHALQVEHIGYLGYGVTLRVGDEDLDATIRLAAQAIPLEPIVVSAFSRRLEAVGFYDRRKRGIGIFIDRKRVDQMNVESASELLRHVPGVRLIPISRTRANQPRNATVGGRGNCRYVFVVDGSRTLSDFEMDYVAGPAIEGVEIYNGMAEVPAAFKAHASSANGVTVCGVVALWTRNSR